MSELDNVLSIYQNEKFQGQRLYHKRAVDHETSIQIGYITNSSSFNRVMCRYSVKISGRILHNIPLVTASSYYKNTGHRPYPLLTGQPVFIQVPNNTRSPVIVGIAPFLPGEDLETIAQLLLDNRLTELPRNSIYPPIGNKLYQELGNFAEIDVKPIIVKQV